MNDISNDIVHLTIDDIPVQVAKGTTVYTAIKKLGIDVPVFCYHDRMPPFGACRVCMVEVENMAKPQTSCTLQATEGMVVKTQAKKAVLAREEILEFLLINHPLDCPICDRGGECPLQDQTVQFGPGKSRFFEEKRHFEKAYSLGPVLTLDRERCITCARCTRFGEIISGDHALEFIDRGHKTEVGTADGGPAQSKFIGNTIMICPVGALTSSVYRFRARPWDNDVTPTTCTLCPVGCSMTLDARDGEIMRTRSLENGDVNDIWLCDKGWFGYEFSSNQERLTQPMLRRHGELVAVSWEEALSHVCAKLSQAKPSGKIAGVGGNTLTIEENYLFQRLFRGLLGSNNVDHRVGQPLFSLADEAIAPGMQCSIAEVSELSDIVVFGLDITEEFPVIWLKIKAAIDKGAKVHFFGHFSPEVSRYIHSCTLHKPGHELATLTEHKERLISLLKESPRPAVFIGSGYLSTIHRKELLAELLSWQHLVPSLSLNLMEGSNNSMGARFAGMHPECGPNGAKLEHPGQNIHEVMHEMATTGWDLLYVAGADIASKVPSEKWQEARKKLGCLIVQDLFLTKTAQDADIVLPTLSYVEKGGSFLSIESRVQKLKPGKAPLKRVYSDSYIFAKIAQKFGFALQIDEPFLNLLAPGRLPITRPESLCKTSITPPAQSDVLTASFSHQLFDHGVRMKHNEHLLGLAKEPLIRLHPNQCHKMGLKDGQKVVVRMKGSEFSKGDSKVCSGEVSGTLSEDTTIAEGSVILPYGFEGCNVHELSLELLNGQEVSLLPL